VGCCISRVLCLLPCLWTWQLVATCRYNVVRTSVQARCMFGRGGSDAWMRSHLHTCLHSHVCAQSAPLARGVDLTCCVIQLSHGGSVHILALHGFQNADPVFRRFVVFRRGDRYLACPVVSSGYRYLAKVSSGYRYLAKVSSAYSCLAKVFLDYWCQDFRSGLFGLTFAEWPTLYFLAVKWTPQRQRLCVPCLAHSFNTDINRYLQITVAHPQRG
jgi:hypothetical protein